MLRTRQQTLHRGVRRKSESQCFDPMKPTPEDTDTSIKQFPPDTTLDWSSFLVLTYSFYTNEQMKAYKSLIACKYFEARFVNVCGAKKIGEHIVIIAKVIYKMMGS